LGCDVQSELERHRAVAASVVAAASAVDVAVLSTLPPQPVSSDKQVATLKAAPINNLGSSSFRFIVTSIDTR
jgi:hypothetical protein